MPISIICQHCGTEFKRPPSTARSARFCSQACNYAYRRAHRDWPKPEVRVAVTCRQCGEDFQVQPSESHRVSCSWECEKAFRAARPTEEHYRYTGKIARRCKWCSAEFEVHPCKVRKDRGRFCSRSCRAAWVCRHAQNRVSLAEREFARFLRKNGFDFDTQVQIKSYIVDVVFPSEHVAVEFDGDYWHDLPRTAAKDRKKDAALRQLGYEVIRVRQTAHEADPAASLARISSAITREVVQ